VSFHDDAQNNQLVQSMIEGMEQRKTQREAEKAKLAVRPEPDLTPQTCVVAFIDILGFGHEIERAQSKEDLERLHAKVRLVQAAFQKESAAENPQEQQEFNRQYGRRVIALSDAVVVVFTPRSEASEVMGEYDRLGFVISELLDAQARCVIDHGIFVRGGVSHGPFFFEDDVLLSPALARAYELESKHADHPVIVISESTRNEILGVPKQGYIDPGWDLMPKHFARHGRKRFRGGKLYFLDYLPYILNEEYLSWERADWEDYQDARREEDTPRAEAALARKYTKNRAGILRGHKQRIEAAYGAVSSERVRKKYRWLMKYHNSSFPNDFEGYRDQVINLSQFAP
jgi:hypothetical protein